MNTNYLSSFQRDTGYGYVHETVPTMDHADYKPPTFEEKVLAMSAKEIIMAMVKALTHPPIVNIDMSTFGTAKVHVKKFLGFIPINKKVCFGCAATNTVCHIGGKKFRVGDICDREKRAKFMGADESFLGLFECSINALRIGDITMYNSYAEAGEFATIKKVTGYPQLHFLDDDYTNDDLIPYKLLADLQEQ